MNGRIIRGIPSGESRHTASNSTTFGCLKHFILAHSSKNDFNSSCEYKSVLVINEEKTNVAYNTHFLKDYVAMYMYMSFVGGGVDATFTIWIVILKSPVSTA